ncbi:MAG: sulfatase [Spirochaetes bacterium]|nr:sulfatase [Spirochaetota bacterium]
MLKLGAATAAGIAGIGGLARCGGTPFEFDEEIYSDPARDRIPAERLIGRVRGFRGRRPNIVVILTDDLGYGDLGCYGNRVMKTPHIDRLAREGVRFTDFYASNSLCSPSRAGLLTGRYAHRTGVTWPVQTGGDSLMRRIVLKLSLALGRLGAIDTRGAQSIAAGLPPSEITLAEALKVAGYATACIGKWHLGDFTTDDRYHPLNHGFDFFTGIVGANDDFPVSFWRDRTEMVHDIGIDQGRYTGLFTDEAVRFIERSKNGPFFLYMAHKDPHLPNIPSERFRDKSECGRYGDTVEEVDWSVGRIMECLARNGLDRDTLVIFTSDNGPWYDGSAAPFRGRKGQSFDGGYRVPMIARWPGRIPAGRTCEAASMNIDFFPTFLAMAGLLPPEDRIVDGRDITGLLTGRETISPHEALYFFHHNELEGVRCDDWKYFRQIHTYTWPLPLDKPNTFFGSVAGGRDYRPEGSDESVPTMASWPVLYRVSKDPGECYNVMKKYPRVAEDLGRRLERFEREFTGNPRGWLRSAVKKAGGGAR